jgi:WD40 repeat protein
MRITPQGEASVFAKVPGFAEHVAYEALSKTVAVASGKKLYLFGTDGQPKTAQPFVLPSSIGGLAVSPIAARLAASHYNGVQIYALDNLKQTEKNGPRSLPWKGSHLSLTYSTDGKWLISSMQENAIHLWRLADGLDLQMRGYIGKPTGFSWSHDGNLLATTGGAGVPLWSFKDKTQGPAGQQARVIAGSNTPDVIVTAVALHPNGPFVAVGYTDGLVLLANLHDQRSILIQAPDEANLTDAVTVLEWSGDGMNLLSATEGGIVLLTDFAKLLDGKAA